MNSVVSRKNGSIARTTYIYCETVQRYSFDVAPSMLISVLDKEKNRKAPNLANSGHVE